MRNRMNECNTVYDLKRKQGNMKAFFFFFSFLDFLQLIFYLMCYFVNLN